MTTHHTYSPSSLERRSLCPYSVHEVEYPDKESASSLEGTLLHEAIFSYNKIILNKEQENLVKICKDFYYNLSISCDEALFEQKLHVFWDNKELYSGTPDVVILNGNKIQIIDWKFGRLEVQEPKNNLQLAAYAAAAMQHYNIYTCDTYIFQPRVSKESKKYTFTNAEAILRHIKKIIDRCEQPNPECIPGEKQCQWCKLKDNMVCPALKNELKTIDKTINLPTLNDTDLISLYERGKIVDKFIKAINDEVKLRIEEKGYCDNKIFKETSGGYTLENITKVYEKVKDVIKKEDFLDICSVSDIDLKKLYCYNRVELKNKDAEDEYIRKLQDLRIPKNKRKTIVNKGEL